MFNPGSAFHLLLDAGEVKGQWPPGLSRATCSAEKTLGRTPRITPDDMSITVQEETVTLSGELEERSTIAVIELLPLPLDGIVGVGRSLEYAMDDLAPAPEPTSCTGTS
ncbi:hypothetical protein ACIRP2_20980 [Streptomyces sp. NPDC101194]|uniref:hypothetical protein n=1 Tax=Streptomyces sp. NPDC101194 TaxID=3366127 RepID=UPI003805688B